jgi:hypothetical protein
VNQFDNRIEKAVGRLRVGAMPSATASEKCHADPDRPLNRSGVGDRLSSGGLAGRSGLGDLAKICFFLIFFEKTA